MSDEILKRQLIDLLERKMISVLETYLHGIDGCEVYNDSGWWETTVGAEFGAKRLALTKIGVRAQAESFIDYLCSNDFLHTKKAPKL